MKTKFTGTLAPVQFLALGITALAPGCASTVTGTGSDVTPDFARADTFEVARVDAIDADAPIDASDGEASAVCSRDWITFDCSHEIAEAICAGNPPCQVCPQDWFPDGGSLAWMAVRQSPSCPCPPPMNGVPHPG